MSAIGGIPDYPFVILPHPLGVLDTDSLREQAFKAAPAVLQILIAQSV